MKLRAPRNKAQVHLGRTYRPGGSIAKTLCRRHWWEPRHWTSEPRKVTCAQCVAALPSGRLS